MGSCGWLGERLSHAVHLSRNIPFLIVEKHRNFYCHTRFFETIVPIGANIRRLNCKSAGNNFQQGLI
jgi:hypothetical protein